MAALPAAALEPVAFTVPGAPNGLEKALRDASLLLRAESQGTTATQDLLAAARSDYARLLGVLYARGHYSGRINIRLDGREAGEINLLDPPAEIARAGITVIPGPVFRFGRAELAPLPADTATPEAFRSGEPALSGSVVAAAEAGVAGWRAAGHAKARVAAQDLVADHPRAVLDARLTLDPGPRLSFGRLAITGQDRMREAAIRRIAGLPVGEVFDPAALERASTRLQRTEVFSTVLIEEAATPNPDGTLDIALTVGEGPRRRLSFGAELESREGLTATAAWLNRNLAGGGERLLAEVSAAGLGGETGADLGLDIRLDRPATLRADTTGFATFGIGREQTEDYTTESIDLGVGFRREFTPRLTGEAGIGLHSSRARDNGDTTIFRRLSVPVRATWDGRDSNLNPTRGLYGDVTAEPFLGFAGTGSGIRLTGDARGYLPLGGGGTVLAGRLQMGSVFGPSLTETPRDDLFYSGGGGTVRGQPYQSLGVQLLRGGRVKTGGQHFLGLSGEIRVPVTGNWGAVAFYDAGYVAPVEFLDGGDWHAGAGLGVRYQTGIGPIRADIAMPVSGDTDEGVQLYIGIGQAF